MHVLFLDQYGNMGGGQQVLLELVRATRELGWSVTALLPAGECAANLRSLGAQVDFVPECRLQQGRKSFVDVFKLLIYTVGLFLSKCRTFFETDMICANGGRMYLLCFIASLFFGKPAIYYVHLNLGAVECRLLRLVLRSRATCAVVLPSSFVKRQLLANSPRFDDPRVRVLENGLDARFGRLQYDDRFSGQPLRHVGIVGRVSPEKGQDVLLPLAKAFPDIRFHVLGDAAFSDKEYFAELRDAAPNNIHFYGWVDDLPGKVAEIGLQVCIVPSRCPPESPDRSFEAAPLVPLQMVALSCLVIVRRLGALADVAQRLGLPFFNTDEELSDCLARLSAMNGIALAQQVHASHALVCQEYSYSVFQQRLQTFWDSL